MSGRSTEARVLAVLDDEPRDPREVFCLVTRDGWPWDMNPTLKVVRAVLARLADAGRVTRERGGELDGGAALYRLVGADVYAGTDSVTE